MATIFARLRERMGSVAEAEPATPHIRESCHVFNVEHLICEHSPTERILSDAAAIMGIF